jgi:hypothetical protein
MKKRTTSDQEAEALARDLIALERTLRGLTNRVRVYRRKIEKENGLAMTSEQVTKFSVEIENRAEALVLVDAARTFEASLRARPYLTGNIPSADKIHVALRALQEWCAR